MILRDYRGDALVLAMSSAVRRDAQGVPTALRIFRPGPVSLTLNGQATSGVVTPQDITDILDYYALKGEPIPVDCEHLLQMLADAKGITESELVASDPLLGEKAAAGYVRLTAEGDELWAVVDRWSPRARELLSGDFDKLYGFFSPVVRGLSTPPLRITSLALTNTPSLNGQDLLAAAGEAADQRLPVATLSDTTPTRRPPMQEWLKKLAELLTLDVAALSAEGADTTPLLRTAAEEITRLRDAASDFVSALREPLALTAETIELKDLAGTLLSALAKGSADGDALTQTEARLAVLEGESRERLVATLTAEGKLTEAMLPWARKQDAAALSEWADAAPVVVKPTRIVDHADLDEGSDTLSMTDADVVVARAGGFDPEAVAKANNLKYAAK